MDGFTKADKGMFKTTGVHTIKAGKIKKEVAIKALPINISEMINDELPYPDAPKRFDKQSKQFIYNYEDQNWLKEKAKIDYLRTCAICVMGIDEEKSPIEGNTLLDKINTLQEMEMPLGTFVELSKAIQELSGIKEDEFRGS